VAEDIFLGPAFLGNTTAPVQLLLNTRIARLEMGGKAITIAHTADGRVVRARVFVDASYEGWLLPLAGVTTSFGRESVAVFNESVAGVLDEPHNASTPEHPFTSQHQLWTGLDPRWPNGSLIPLITPPPGPVGSGDDRLQAFNVLVTLTSNTSNMVQPWPRPTRYDPTQFELLRRYIAANNITSFYKTGLCCGGSLPALPGLNRSKYDVNSQKLDFQGLNWPYAKAIVDNDWAAQEAVWNAHRDLTLGAYYMLSIDPVFSEEMTQVGLPLDEHIACGHLPCQVYVREALRMVSDFVFTQADRETAVNKSDTVGMGSYSIDVMHGSTFASPLYGILQEGGMQAPSFLPPSLPPFQIPWRALIPRRAEVSNLIVPTAVSSSHVGFCAIRLEPTWLVLGESAGVAAALVAAGGGGGVVQDLDVPTLQARLRALGQVLEL
jgi:hypothetical protein